jgi:hypothetical protein
MSRSARLTDIAVILKHETAKAWLVNDGIRDVWIAKSQAELTLDDVKGAGHVLTLPEWLAKEKELI